MNTFNLTDHGISVTVVHRNLAASVLYEHAIHFEREARLADSGALVAYSGDKTGRSPRDKFIVREPTTDQHVCWGAINQPMDPARYAQLEADLAAYLRGRDIYVQDLAGGADPAYRLPVRVSPSWPGTACSRATCCGPAHSMRPQGSRSSTLRGSGRRRHDTGPVPRR